jgi:hypothetical protein
MKFDSSAIPLLPTLQQLAELNDLLVSATELYQIYATLENHPRVIGSQRSVDLFNACTEQLRQDISIIDEHLEILVTLSRSNPNGALAKPGEETAAIPHMGRTEEPASSLFIPDAEPIDVNKSVFEIVRKSFHIEDIFSQQLKTGLQSAQIRKHLKLELQLKMIILSADQRCRLLEDRYGYARSKSILFQGLRRQTTRFLSVLSGDKRTDIDQ